MVFPFFRFYTDFSQNQLPQQPDPNAAAKPSMLALFGLGLAGVGITRPRRG
jgi:hypothetical protein